MQFYVTNKYHSSQKTPLSPTCTSLLIFEQSNILQYHKTLSPQYCAQASKVSNITACKEEQFHTTFPTFFNKEIAPSWDTWGGFWSFYERDAKLTSCRTIMS